MNRGDVVVGNDYGYRQNLKRHTPLERVRAVEIVRGRWKVEWVDPNPGLTDYVRAINVVVPWKDGKAFLRDEARMDTLVAHCATIWPGHSHPVSSAVDAVLEATGEHLWVNNRGVLEADPGGAERVARRAGIELQMAPPAFAARDDAEYYPFDEAVTLAQGFARAEPGLVNLAIDGAEAKIQREAREPGNQHLLSLAYEWAAANALIREWAGSDEPLARRDREIERLHRLVVDAIYVLRSSGHDADAARLDRKFHS
jgi:hypothetical protein